MTYEEMRDLAEECGLDWHRGFAPLFDGDETNRFAVLIEAAQEAERERIESDEALMRQCLETMERLHGGCTDSEDGTVEAITVWCPELIDALRNRLGEKT